MHFNNVYFNDFNVGENTAQKGASENTSHHTSAQANIKLLSQ